MVWGGDGGGGGGGGGVVVVGGGHLGCYLFIYSWLGLEFDRFRPGSQLHAAPLTPCEILYAVPVPSGC